MPMYETALVLDPALEEEGLNERVQRYVDLLTEHGAQEINQDRRGTRKLAYTIKGKDGEWRTQADYTYFVYDAPPAAVRPVEDQLRLDEDVLRYMTVRYEAEPVPEVEEEVTPDEASSDEANSVDVVENGEEE